MHIEKTEAHRFAQDVLNYLRANVRDNAVVHEAPISRKRWQGALFSNCIAVTFEVLNVDTGTSTAVKVQRYEYEGRIWFSTYEGSNGVCKEHLARCSCPIECKYQQEYYDALDGAVEYSG